MNITNNNGLRLLTALAITTALTLPACGGGGGGGGGGSGPADTPPTAAWIQPTTGVVALVGDSFDVEITANDDGLAQVEIWADADQDLATTPDQTRLFGPVDDPNGGTLSPTLDTSLLAGEGGYTLFIRVEDGSNPTLEVELPQALTVYAGLAGVNGRNSYGVSGNAIIFSAGETENGAGAPSISDGDLTLNEGIATVIDTQSGVRTVGGVEFDISGGSRPDVLSASGGRFAWIPPTTTLAYWAAGVEALPTENSYRGVQKIVYLGPERIVAPISEAPEGDRNADNDTNDVMYAALDLNSASTSLDQYAPWVGALAAGGTTAFEHDGPTLVVFPVSESAFAGAPPTDFNGDSRSDATFLFSSDLATNAPGPNNLINPVGATLGLAVPRAVDPTAKFAASLADPNALVAYVVDEGAIGVGGSIVNADGDTSDYVPAVWTLGAGTPAETILAVAAGTLNCGAGLKTMFWDGNVLLFTAKEEGRGTGILQGTPVIGGNGDGDGTDKEVLLWWDQSTVALPQTTLDFVNLPEVDGLLLDGLCLDGGGSATRLAPGVVGVVVNEFANNVDFNGDLDTGDNVFLLIDTTTTPPTVHRPALTGFLGVIPTATAGIPITGVADATGVVVQLGEAGTNGNLNGDADTIDVLLGYVSFGSPGSVLLLDRGGDEVVLKNGLIGVTVNESYTDAGNTTFSFKIYDTAGVTVQDSLPCASVSVPATDNGSLWAYLRDEGVLGENMDLNGDGDSTDLILAILRP